MSLSPRHLVAVPRLARLTLFVSLIVLGGCGGNQTTTSGTSAPIQIGLLEPFTGFGASLGQQARLGAQLALDESKGQVQGHSVQFVSVDDGCAPETGVNAVNKLVGQVIAVIGPECSSVAAAGGPVLRRASIPYFPGAYLPQLTERGDDYIFRAKASDRYIFKVTVQMMKDQNLASGIAVAHDSSAYGSGATQVFDQELTNAGLPAPLVDAPFDISATDFTGQIESIKKANAKVIVVIAFEQQSGLFTKQARQLGLTTPIIAGPGGAQAYQDAAGKSVDGVRYVARFDPNDAATANFTAAFKKANGFDPAEPALGAYLAMRALLDALNRVGPDTKGSALRDALRSENLDTAAGKAAWTSSGDLKSPVAIEGSYQGDSRVIAKRVVG